MALGCLQDNATTTNDNSNRRHHWILSACGGFLFFSEIRSPRSVTPFFSKTPHFPLNQIKLPLRRSPSWLVIGERLSQVSIYVALFYPCPYWGQSIFVTVGSSIVLNQCIVGLIMVRHMRLILVSSLPQECITSWGVHIMLCRESSWTALIV